MILQQIVSRARKPSVRSLALCATALALVTTAPAFADIVYNNTYNASTLGSATQVFNGGTVKVDTTNTLAQNFALAQPTTGASTIDENAHSVIFSGVFSDNTSLVPGSVTFTDSVGGGNATLTGISTFTGTATIDSGATLTLGSTGTITTASVTANGNFDISQTPGASIISLAGTGNVLLGNQTLSISDSVGTFSGVISGGGSINVIGGTQVLAGANTYTGNTTITGGTLVIGAGSNTGSILGNVADNGTLGFNRSDTVSFGNTINGSGGLSQLGSGTLILTTTDTYTGATNVAAGTLALSSTGNISGSSQVTATGIFDISATSGTSIKSLAGAGTVQLGSQTLTLTAANGTFSGTIQGSGGITITGGTQTLTGLESYTGATLVSGGVLQLGGSVVSNNITDNATISFYSTQAVAMSGVISGAGAVTQSGNGTTTVSAVQTYTGKTTIALGTLALSGTGSIAASSSVEDDATFDISAAGNSGATISSLTGTGSVNLGSQILTLSNAAGTFSGAINGTGGIAVAAGSETLSSDSNYTGVTSISSGATLFLTSTNAIAFSSRVADNGTLDVSGVTTSGLVPSAYIDSLSGGGKVVLGTKALTLTAAGDTFSGVISGTGGLSVSGGTETLTGANTYTGNTTISGGILAIAGAGSISSAGTVTDNGVFDISGAAGPTVSLGALAGSGTVTVGANSLNIVSGNSSEFSGTISGTGGLTISGGTQILSGSNSYSGATLISAGTLQLGNNNAGGSLVGNVTDNGTLAFARSDSSAFGGVISGTGAVTQIGNGTTALTAANTYTGTTTITAGTLQLGNGGTSGSITGNVTDNGALGFDRGDATSFSGTIAGTGGISLIGTGAVTLTPVESYTGTTTISNVSDLIIGGGGSIATSSDVVDNGILDLSALTSPQLASLGGSGSVLAGTQTLTLTNGIDTFSGNISGAGGLTVSGGTQVLSGTNSYTGATVINGGRLTVNGSIASSSGVTVNSSGTLGGAGATSKVAVTSGGTLAPDAGMTINGGLSMANGSTFLATVSSAEVSKASVNGAATVGGTLSVTNGGGSWLLGQKETVLTATNGVGGTFTAAPIVSAGAQYASTVSYDANDVFVTVNLSKLSPLLPTTASVNAAAPIAGIDAAITKGDVVPATIQNLGSLTSAQLGTAAPQLNGEIAADLPQAGAAMLSPFMNAMVDHQSDARPGQHGSMWITGIGSSALVDGSDTIGSSKFKQHIAGLALGYDKAATPGFTAGGALSFGSSNFHLGDSGNGTGSADTIQGGLYGTLHPNRVLYTNFELALASDTISTQRSVTISSTDQLNGHAKTLAFGGRLEEGANLGWLTPYAAFDDTLVRTPDYAETASAGASNFALHYASRSANFANVELGIRQRSDTRLDRDWSLVLTDRLAWQHTLSGVWDAQANFASLPDSTFSVLGAQPTKDAGLLTLGAALRHRGFDINLHIESEVGRNSQSYAAIGGLGFTW